jgi:hypothetical protein
MFKGFNCLGYIEIVAFETGITAINDDIRRQQKEWRLA